MAARYVQKYSCFSEYIRLLFSMSKPSVPVVILVRVSTVRQDTDRQATELRAVADSRGWEVVEVLEERVSGRAEEMERSGLHRVEELARTGKMRKVLVHEVSRVARRVSLVHSFVEMLESFGVSLYWHAQAIETLLPSGKRNPAAGIMLAVLAEMARAETETLRERINSGLEEARRKGVRLGRPKGSGATTRAFLAKHRDVTKLLRDGQSIRNVAKITGKGISTVQRVKSVVAERE